MCNRLKNSRTECVCAPEGSKEEIAKWKRMYVDPDDPLLMLSPEPEDFYKRRVHFFFPEALGLLKHIPCPNCGDVAGKVILDGWNKRGPRLVCDMGRNYWFISKQYSCNECDTSFRPYDTAVYPRLPKEIQHLYQQ